MPRVSRKQAELPNTRRADEPKPQEPDDELDALCAKLDKSKGGVVVAGQKVVEAKQALYTKMREKNRTSHRYEDAKGVEREVFLNEVVRTRKIKVEDNGDNE